jgi:hypothetical protein
MVINEMWNVKTIRRSVQVAILLGIVGGLSLQTAIASQATVKRPRPRLTTSEIAKFKKALQADIQVSLDLAGIDKQALPPELPAKLRSYRWAEATQRKNPTVTPFLGTWVQQWSTFPPHFVMTVFPSTTKGRICIIEQQFNNPDKLPPLPGEKIPPDPPVRFSTATVSNNQTVGSDTRLARSLILPTRPSWINRNIEFLGAVTPQNRLQIYASKDVPTIDLKTLPTQVQQQFKASGCVTPAQ